MIITKMSNDKIFKALSCATRTKIIEILTKKEIHLTGLAKEIGISVPVTSRHVKILEEVGIIEKRIIGNVYLLSAKTEVLEGALDKFVEKSVITIDKQENILAALEKIPGIEIQQVGDNKYITSIDGEKGHFIYRVDGNMPKMPIDKYRPQKNVTVEVKKIISVNKKKINLKIKNKSEK